ncbi:MAG: zinc-dependent peptidase [Cyclobacteriaceae bacterium]
MFLFFFFLICAMIFVPSLIKRHGEYILPLPGKSKETLNRYFEYYIGLSAQNKAIFERRVHRFMRMKEFVPRGVDRVTLEMKTLISACAIQLTFGYPRVYLQHFRRILIYEDSYYSDINKQYHKGEVNPRHGLICLSWKAFVEGYIEKEGINLGLHEMAHALHFENLILNDEFDFINPRDLKQWGSLATKEIERIRNGNNTFLRKYGATNENEFFAVAVENFFERPKKFKEDLPEVYRALCKLLRQNPLELVAAVP